MNLISRAFSRVAVAAAVLTLGLAVQAHASTELITNGNFSSASSANTSAMLNYNGFTVDGWTSNIYSGHQVGYNFLFTSGDATATGYDGNLQLWTTSNGGRNTITASPDGGNFLAMDGAYNPSSITQTVSGLTVGSTYDLSFYYAGAQQKGYYSATTESFKVSFTDGTTTQTFTTGTLNNQNMGFTGWYRATTRFTATSTSETLNFLAQGSPQGVPPFSLLDGVSLQVTPEPSSLMLLGTGILSIGGVLRRRFSK